MISVAMTACGAGARPVVTTDDGADTAAPDLAELRTILASVNQHLFTAEEQSLGCPEETTVAAYLAMLEENTRADPSEPDRINELTGGCDVPRDDGMWPAPDPAHWSCRVMGYTSDAAGESSWRYELRFLVRRASRTLDPTWIACPGMP